MSEMLFLLFLHGLFQFGAKKGNERAIMGGKNNLDMSFSESPPQDQFRNQYFKTRPQ